MSQRRAGDSGGPQQGLKDWQRNTWNGPVIPPQETNPFDEPDNAPELLELRSENVRDKSGEFWNGQPTGTQNRMGNTVNNSTAFRRRSAKKEKQSGSWAVRAAVILVAVVAAAVMILYFGIFRIREIRVEGNMTISASDIIRFSGLKYGESILTLNEDEIGQRIISAAHSAANADPGNPNYNYYLLQFRYMDRRMPGTVIISVREREACCWTRIYGRMYVMDKDLMILYDSEDMDMRPELVEVTGLEVRSDCQVGQSMVLKSSVQQGVFENLFLEMKVLGCTELIEEVKLNDISSIFIVTRDGYTVSLGDRNRLHAKLRSMLLVREELLRMDSTGGSIDVSVPETPYYSPASGQN